MDSFRRRLLVPKKNSDVLRFKLADGSYLKLSDGSYFNVRA